MHHWKLLVKFSFLHTMYGNSVMIHKKFTWHLISCGVTRWRFMSLCSMTRQQKQSSSLERYSLYFIAHLLNKLSVHDMTPDHLFLLILVIPKLVYISVQLSRRCRCSCQQKAELSFTRPSVTIANFKFLSALVLMALM